MIEFPGPDEDSVRPSQEKPYGWQLRTPGQLQLSASTGEPPVGADYAATRDEILKEDKEPSDGIHLAQGETPLLTKKMPIEGPRELRRLEKPDEREPMPMMRPSHIVAARLKFAIAGSDAPAWVQDLAGRSLSDPETPDLPKKPPMVQQEIGLFVRHW